MSRAPLCLGLLAAILVGASASAALAQTVRPADLPWVGSARCQLDIQGSGYVDQQIHTWTLTGGTPTIAGAFHVYGGTWSVTGGGSSQRTVGTQISTSRWTTNAQGVSAPIAVLARAADGAVVIQAYHGQLRARGAVTGGQQVVTDGRPLPPIQILADAFEWALPVVSGTPTSTMLSGSSTLVVSGSIGYLQPADARGTASCTWQFSLASAASSSAAAIAVASPTLSIQQPALTTQSGAQAGTATQVTLSPAGSTTTIQQVDTTATATGTLATQPVSSGTMIVSPLGSTTLSTIAGSTSVVTGSRTITLAGFTGTGTFTAVASRTLTLAGFSGAGTFSAVAPRTLVLAGFTAAGVATAVAPRTITVAGFTAAGSSSAVAPRTITLTGWTSAGP